ncbi:hypothetical protein G6F56_013196 [Rhizopus delemar]|nr:hypothetical protein G6F56_013196 [Rhizopus delemar]
MRNTIDADAKDAKVEMVCDIQGFNQEYVDGFRDNTGSTEIQLTYGKIDKLVEYLFSLPTLWEYMLKNPYIAKRDDERVYNDIPTSQWWHDLQQEVGLDTVVLAVMLFSNMTLVNNNGRKKAWPLYLTLGNIPKSIRYLEAYRACRVLAYLPIITTIKGKAIPSWWSHCKVHGHYLEAFQEWSLCSAFFRS